MPYRTGAVYDPASTPKVFPGLRIFLTRQVRGGQVQMKAGRSSNEGAIHGSKGFIEAVNSVVIAKHGQHMTTPSGQVPTVKEDAEHIGVAGLIAIGQIGSSQIERSAAFVSISGVGVQFRFNREESCTEPR